MSFRVQPRCDDYDVIGAIPRDLSIVKNFLKRDCAVKRLIDIEEEFLQECMERGEDPAKPKKNQSKQQGTAAASMPGQLQPGEEPKPPINPCLSKTPEGTTSPDFCDPCRRLPTSIVLEELTKPATFNSVYNQSSPPYFDEETVLGSALPVKFRFRRKSNKCEFEKTSNLMCSSNMANTNVVVLTNCCDIMVWPSQKVAQMNRVPVTMISGPGDLTEYMLEEETIM